MLDAHQHQNHTQHNIIRLISLYEMLIQKTLPKTFSH